MNKKKLVSLCLVLALLVTAAIGGTMAYFTDKDQEVNVFTTGNVDIDLEENFGNVLEDGTKDVKLLPGKDVKKEVFVRNEGTEPAYVRVHVAVPSILDSGDDDQPQFAAYNNTLHWNFSKASVADGKWNWHKTNVNGSSLAGWPGNGGDWNTYSATIDGKAYTVYVATYETALEAEAVTDNAIYKVYLDTKVTNDDITKILKELGEIKIHVAAQAVQSEGFDNAYDAFTAAYKSNDLSNPWSE